MYGIVIALTILASILMIGVVLIQKSKGGGLSSQFGGANQLMGVRRTNDVVEKITWYLAAAIAILAIVAALVMPKTGDDRSSRVQPVATEQTAAPGFATDAPEAATEAPAAATTDAPAAEAPATTEAPAE